MQALTLRLRVPGRVAFFRSYWQSVGLTIKMSTTSSSRPRVFVSRRVAEEARQLLDQTCEVLSWDSDVPPARDHYLRAVNGVQGLLCLLTDKIDAELLDAAGSSLRVVSTMSVGYDHIDLKECGKRNIKVGYTPGILTAATAELTVALLLATSRRLKEGMRAVESGEWGTWKPMWLCGPGLEGATVGIVGLGRIGLAVSRCLKPFGVASFLYSGRSERREDAEEVGAKFVTFDELLVQSDFVVVCCALTEDTTHLFNASTFKKMKNTAIFVNTSRGGIVNQDDLLEALQTGQIGAAGLDVTTPEPLPTDSPLLKLSNCVIVPHVGSATHKTRTAMAVLAANNLIAGLKGQQMPHQLQTDS